MTQLFFWIASCALLTLGLGANPLYAGVALLLWMIPVQAIVAVVLQVPSLVVLVGILEILIALASSYLLMSDYSTDQAPQTVLTDISFPTEITSLPPAFGIGSMTDSLEAIVRRRWQDWMTANDTREQQTT